MGGHSVILRSCATFGDMVSVSLPITGSWVQKRLELWDFPSSYFLYRSMVSMYFISVECTFLIRQRQAFYNYIHIIANSWYYNSDHHRIQVAASLHFNTSLDSIHGLSLFPLLNCFTYLSVYSWTIRKLSKLPNKNDNLLQ